MTTNTAHSLAREELVRVLTVFSGVTTSDGAEDYSTLIDSSLIGENDFITGKTILLMSGDAKYEDKGVASFDRDTGTITLESVVSAQIVAGTLFKILNISSVETLIKDLFNGLISFSGTTTSNGGAGGSSLICSDLEGEADFNGNQVVITSGDYKGQARDITADTRGGTVTPHLNFGGVIVEGTEFIITAIRVVPAEVAALAADLGDMADAATNDNMSDITTTSALAKLRLILNRLSPDAFTATIQGAARTALDTMLAQLATYFSAGGAAMSIQVNNQTARTNLEQALEDFFAVIGCDGTNIFNPTIGGSARTDLDAALAAIGTALAALVGATGLFHEQADVLLSFNTVSGSETNVLNLAVASTRYIVRSLRLKFADPGANTITVRLYELVNDVLTEVDSFEVTTANFGTYHSLMDMFGMAQLAGDNLKVTTRVSAGGDLATTGQYSHAKTNV